MLHLGQQASDPWGRLESHTGDQTLRQTFPWEEECCLLSPPPWGQPPAETLQISPPHLISTAEHSPGGSRRAEALGRRCKLDGAHPGEGLRITSLVGATPGWGTSRPQASEASWGGGGQPPPREAPSSHFPMTRDGERNRELHPSEPPQLQPFSAKGGCSSPSSPGVPISSTLITSVV